MAKLISRKSALLALDWCIEKYGPSRFADLDTLRIRLDSSVDYLGEYDEIENLISLNPKLHRSLKHWVSTVIHEYTHFKQPVFEKYDEYFDKYGRNYENHPYEITANNRSNRHAEEAQRWVLHQLRELNKKSGKL